MDIQKSGQEADPLRMTAREAAIAAARREIDTRQTRLQEVEQEQTNLHAEFARVEQVWTPASDKLQNLWREEARLGKKIKQQSKVVDHGDSETVIKAARDVISQSRARIQSIRQETGPLYKQCEGFRKESDGYKNSLEKLTTEVSGLKDEIWGYTRIIESGGKKEFRRPRKPQNFIPCVN